MVSYSLTAEIEAALDSTRAVAAMPAIAVRPAPSVERPLAIADRAQRSPKRRLGLRMVTAYLRR
jgi:hypothetical protein